MLNPPLSEALRNRTVVDFRHKIEKIHEEIEEYSKQFFLPQSFEKISRTPNVEKDGKDIHVFQKFDLAALKTKIKSRFRRKLNSSSLISGFLFFSRY